MGRATISKDIVLTERLGTADSPPTQDLMTEETDGADWPYASLFFAGSFGTKTPAGRRLARRSRLAMVAALGAMMIGAERAGSHPLLLAAVTLLIPVSAGLIGFESARYFRQLDELSRRIQLEALAVAYGVAAVSAFGPFSVSRFLLAERGWFSGSLFGISFAAELARCTALVVFTRRYR